MSEAKDKGIHTGDEEIQTSPCLSEKEDLRNVTSGESEVANSENIQTYCYGMKIKPSQDTAAVFEEDKSVFLKAIELSPSVSITFNESKTSEIKNTKASCEARFEKTETDLTDSKNIHLAVTEEEKCDAAEKGGNGSNKDALELHVSNFVASVKADGEEILGTDIEIINKSDDVNISAEKEVHFSSPLAIIHEFSQSLSSQSTLSLKESDDSQTLDSDCYKKSQYSDCIKFSKHLIGSEAVTSGGDCFSVQISEAPIDVNKTENDLEEMNNMDGITNKIVKQNAQMSRAHSVSVLSGTMAKNSSTRINMITQVSFNKLPLSENYSDQIVRESQELITISEPNLSAHHASGTAGIIQKNRSDIILSIEEKYSKIVSCDVTEIRENVTGTDGIEFNDNKKTSRSIVKSSEYQEGDTGNTTQNTRRLMSPELTKNSSQDLFDSSPDMNIQEPASDKIAVASNDPIRDCVRSINTSPMGSELKPNCFSQQNKCQTDGINTDDLSFEGRILGGKSLPDSLREITDDGNKICNISDEMKDHSQNDLFEGNTSSETLSPVEEIQSSYVHNKMKTNEENETDKDKLSGKNKAETNTNLSESKADSFTNFGEFLVKPRQCFAKNTTIDKPESLKEGEKRKLKEVNIMAEAKKTRVSDEERRIAVQKRYSLFKDCESDFRKHHTKKAKLCELEGENMIESEISDKVAPLIPKKLAVIVSEVINSLEENIIWAHKSTDTVLTETLTDEVANNFSESGDLNERFYTNNQDKGQNTSINEGISESQASVQSKKILNADKLNTGIEIQYLEHRNICTPANVTVDSSGKVSGLSSKTPHINVKVENHTGTEHVKNSIQAPSFGGMSNSADMKKLNESPVFVSALEYHSQCSQNSSTGFEPKTSSQDLVISSQGSAGSVPVYGGSVHSHSVTEVYEEGFERTNIDNPANYGALLDLLVDAAVDHVVPDGIETEEQLSDPSDDNTDTLIKDTVEDSRLESKIYACDVDIGEQDGSPVCKPLAESCNSLLNMEDKTLSSYCKCFNWKYTPSCDYDPETLLARDTEEDSNVIRITPLKTCGRPVRVGLSRRQRVNHLHNVKHS